MVLERNYLIAKEHTASIKRRNFHLLFSTRSICLVTFCVEGRGAGQPFVIFQIILAVDRRSHEFVILSIAARLTDVLSPRNPVYYIFHVCYLKTK